MLTISMALDTSCMDVGHVCAQGQWQCSPLAWLSTLVAWMESRVCSGAVAVLTISMALDTSCMDVGHVCAQTGAVAVLTISMALYTSCMDVGHVCAQGQWQCSPLAWLSTLVAWMWATCVLRGSGSAHH